MNTTTVDKLIGMFMFLVGAAMNSLLPHPSQTVQTLGVMAMVGGLMSALHAQFLGPLLQRVAEEAFLGSSSKSASQ